MRKLFPHVIFQRTIESFDDWCLHYRIHRIMVEVVFFQEYLYICILKFFSHIGLQIFRTSSIALNYLCDCCSHFSSIFCFERYSVLIQHVDNDENVMVIFWIVCTGASRPHQLATGIRKLWRLRKKFFLVLERTVLPSVATFRDFSSQTCFIFFITEIMRKILQRRKRCWLVFRCRLKMIAYSRFNL